jgi:hypothetical protein
LDKKIIWKKFFYRKLQYYVTMLTIIM